LILPVIMSETAMVKLVAARMKVSIITFVGLLYENLEKTLCLWAVQKCSGAKRAKTEPRGVYRHTLSGAV
jgi:hypothetical protein